MTDRSAKLVALAILAVFAGLAWHFAGAQSLWTDEVTQLSGLGLPLGAQLDWLMGGANPIPGVPPDRMPPLSYWLGSLWAGAFGLSEMSLRAMGILACLAAAPAIWLAARRLSGPSPLPAVLVLALIYLAPGMVTQSVEIRAYPLFFGFACWSIWAFLVALDRPDPRRLGLLTLICLGAIYTHFFGLVMAGLLWLTLLAARRRGAVFLGGLATLVLSAGLYPFVRAAMGVTGAVTPPAVPLTEALRDTVRLAFRLMFHGSHLASLPLLALGMLALAGLALLLLRERHRASAWLVLPIILAFVTLPVLKLKIAGFDVLAPHYNLWLVPVFVLALTPALGRRAGMALAAVILGTHLWADRLLIWQPGLFTHGPGDWVAETIRDPAASVVIHDAAGDWAQAYFTLYYRSGGKLTQVLRQDGEPDLQLLPGVAPQPIPQGFAKTFATAVFLRAAPWSSSALAAIADHPEACTLPPMLEAIPAQTRCAFSSAVMQVVQDGT